MNEGKIATVSLRDLCDTSIAVAGLMYDLDNDELDRPYTHIEAIHAIVEEWAADEKVLGVGCHPDHRCSLCQEYSDLAYWGRRHQFTGEWVMSGSHPGVELTAGLSSRLEMGGTVTYDCRGIEFLLEHVSEAVVRVTHCEETGYFGLSAESHTSDFPYTRTGDDCEVGPAGIGGLHLFHSFATPQAALDSTCAMLLDASGVVDTRRFYRLPKEPLPRPGGLGDTTMSNKTKVAVRLDDLCVIADAMTGMQHDLDNGKTKNLDEEIARIHTIVESWARDENVLGVASCHDDHRCRSCRDFPVLSGLQAARWQASLFHSRLSNLPPGAFRDAERTELSYAPTPPEDFSTMTESNEKRQHVNEDGEIFILESISDSVVRVTHREQTGYIGISQDRDSFRPYRNTMAESLVHTDGIGGQGFPFATPDEALRSLCDLMLADHRLEGTRRSNSQEGKQVARQVLAEFMDELPVPGSRYPPEQTARLGRALYRRDIRHQLVNDHHGEIVAIDVDSGRWAVAGDTMEAVDRLRELVPGAINILCEKVGYRALIRFGGSQLGDPVE